MPRLFFPLDPPPISWQLRTLFESAPFTRDATALLAIPDATLAAVRQACESEGFVSAADVDRVVDEVVDERGRRAVKNTLRNLPEIFEQYDGESTGYEKLLRSMLNEALVEKNSELTPQQVDHLTRTLVSLSAPTNGMRRQMKANRLAAAVGAQVERFEIVTDVRPVFDNTRTDVEGFVVVTTATLITNDPTRPELILRLSEADLAKMHQKIEEAQRKLLGARKALAGRAPIAQVEDTE